MDINVLLQAIGIVTISIIIVALITLLFDWTFKKKTKFAYTITGIIMFVFVTFMAYAEIMANKIK